MLPILDISHYLSDPTGIEGQKFVEQLLTTCHESGFFYLVGHGVDQSCDNQILQIARKFFDLPLAEREAIAIGRSPHFRGYTLLKNERTNGRVDWRDQIDIGPEEPAPDMLDGDPPWKQLSGPNQWPPGLPSMPGHVQSWMEQIQPLGLALMRALADGLGQGAHFFDARMTPNPYTRVKIIRYPSLPEEERDGQGLGLHHDSGVLTFILQDETPGLQVMSEGKLVDVDCLPGAYVVNLGEMMQSATSGYLKATKHQVISPPAGKQRLSVAYFMNPRLDATFEPLTLPAKLSALAPGGQNPDPADPIFHTFGLNTLKIRMRSHPDVTAAYYSDVNLDQSG